MIEHQIAKSKADDGLSKQSFCFLLCRFFSHTVYSLFQKPWLVVGSKQFWVTGQKWQKPFGRFSEYENSMTHKNLFTMAWIEVEVRNWNSDCCDVLQRIMIHTEKQLNILTTIIDVVIFIGNKGLAYQILSWWHTPRGLHWDQWTADLLWYSSNRACYKFFIRQIWTTWNLISQDNCKMNSSVIVKITFKITFMMK